MKQTNPSHKPFLIIISVILFVVISLGSIFVVIYFQQKQLATNPKNKIVKSQKSNSVLSTSKETPFLEILDTKNQISTESGKEWTSIAMSEGLGCQPEFFDPQISKYSRLEQTDKTGSYWDKDIYQFKENNASSSHYEFSIKTIPASTYTITAYEFGCASSWDYVLDIRNNNKRTALYTHVDNYYLSDDKNSIFLDNYLKNQKGTYDHKRRIISMDGIKKAEIPSMDCVSRWATLTNNTFVSYSAEPDMQTDRKTKICVWDTNGNLKSRLQAELTWYGASSDSLWAEIGVLPQDPHIFYAYDNNNTSTPKMCSLYLQDLTDQKRNKTIDLFLEGSDSMPQHLCPWNPSVSFDFSQTTFESPKLKFKLNSTYGTDKYYGKYTTWQTPPTLPLQSSLLYTYNSNASFSYPSYLIKGRENTGGSSYLQEFKEENGQFTLTFSNKGNYNQITGKPYATVDEYINMPNIVKSVVIDGQQGRQPLPRAGSENVFSASFFSKDSKSIYTLELQVMLGTYLQADKFNTFNDEFKINDGEKIFNKIISSFKFLNTAQISDQRLVFNNETGDKTKNTK